jgi:hypothetical protein
MNSVQIVESIGNTLIFDEITEEIWVKICYRLKGESYGSVQANRHCLKSISKIVVTLPTALKELQRKKWRLIYRGSEDGFRTSDFDRKCDKKSNTVTIIETTEGFIFGGFTPIAWESRDAYKTDDIGGSFLFSVKNPHKHEIGRIVLKDARYAIRCCPSYGPTFGNGCDIHVSDNCNANTSSYTRLGIGYVNQTGIDEYEVFTGRKNFTVREIEVFTISE